MGLVPPVAVIASEHRKRRRTHAPAGKARREAVRKNGRIEIRCKGGRVLKVEANLAAVVAAGTDPLGGRGMIAPGANVRVYLACGVTACAKDRRAMALVQSSLRQQPASGSVFAFRGRRGDRIKLLFWDGQGFCLY